MKEKVGYEELIIRSASFKVVVCIVMRNSVGVVYSALLMAIFSSCEVSILLCVAFSTMKSIPLTPTSV